MLTHVDNLGDLNLDMTSQEESLQSIDSSIDTIKSHVSAIRTNSTIISESNNSIDRDCSDIKIAIGRTADADTETTVIGLLKSIANKLS